MQTEMSCQSADGKQSPSRLEVNCLSFNLWNSLVRFPDGIDAVAQCVRENNADIIGFQEVDETTLNAIAKALGDPYRACWAGGIVSRFPILAEFHQGLRVYGTILQVAPHVKLRFFNSHLKAYPYGPYLLRDGHSVEEVIAATVDTQLEEDGRGLKHGVTKMILSPDPVYEADLPTVFVGDHNTPSHLDHTESASLDPKYSALRNFPCLTIQWPISAYLSDCGFVDSFREVHSSPLAEPGLTWTPGELHGFVKPDEVHDRIDFIYHRSGSQWSTRCTSSSVIDSIPKFVWPSDHRAVLSRIVLERLAN